MMPEDGEAQKQQDGWEEKAANLLNAVMVMSIGAAIGAVGAWGLWRFGTDFTDAPPGPDWLSLGFPVLSLIVCVQTVRFGAGMLRSKKP